MESMGLTVHSKQCAKLLVDSQDARGANSERTADPGHVAYELVRRKGAMLRGLLNITEVMRLSTSSKLGQLSDDGKLMMLALDFSGRAVNDPHWLTAEEDKEVGEGEEVVGAGGVVAEVVGVFGGQRASCGFVVGR